VVAYNIFNNKHKNLSLIDKIKKFKMDQKFPLNFIKLRNKYIKNYTEMYKDTPFCVLSNTIKEFVTSLKSVFTKICKHQIEDFDFKHRDIYRSQRTLNIDVKYCTPNKGPYPSILGTLEIKNRKKNKFKWSDVKKGFKIVYLKYENNFYIHAPILVKKKEIKEPREKIVSIDPGENKFVTGYGMNNYFYIGSRIRKRIRKRLKRIDELKAKIIIRKKKKMEI